MSEAEAGTMKLATGILLGLVVALFGAAAITPILKDGTRWFLLLLGCFLFLVVCVLISEVMEEARRPFWRRWLV